MEHSARTPRVCVLVIGALVASLVAFAAPAPAVAATECTGTLDGATVRGDLVVPAGAFCYLINSEVRGRVDVAPGGFADIFRTTVRGGVAAMGHTWLVIGESEVRGNVVATGAVAGDTAIVGSILRGDVTFAGNATPGIVGVDGSSISGNLTVSGNEAGFFSIGFDEVRGTITLSDNTSDKPIEFVGNHARGNIACGNNSPTLENFGITSTTRGEKSGQCENI